MYDEIILALIVSIDTCIAAAAYCNSGIKIPLPSAVTISAVSAAVLALALRSSYLIGQHIPVSVCSRCSQALLTFIGLFIIVRSMVRIFTKHLSDSGGLSLKNKKTGIVMKLYLDDTAADLDDSKVLSVPEASLLALAGSLDSAAMGLGSGYSGVKPFPAFIFTFAAGTLSLILGASAGKKISSLRTDLSWTGGILMILFALFCK